MIRGVIGATEQVDLRNQMSTDKAGKVVAAIIEYVIQGGQTMKKSISLRIMAFLAMLLIVFCYLRGQV